MNSEVDIISRALNDNANAVKAFKESADTRLEKLEGSVFKFKDRLIEVEQKLVPNTFNPGPVNANRGGIHINRENAYRKMLASEAMQAFKANHSSGTGKIPLEINLKAVTSLQGSAEVVPVGVDVRPNRLGFVEPPQPALSLLELLPFQPATSNAVEAPVFSANSLSSSDYQEGEATEKPEGTFTIDWENFPIATLSQHVTVSRQLLDDEPMLMATIDRLMRYNLRRKVESELLNGTGTGKHIKGLLAYGTPFSSTPAFKAGDRLGEAAAATEDLGFQPGAAVLRSAEWFKIGAERDTAGSYVAGGWAVPATQQVWGKRVVKSSAMPANTGLLLDLGMISVIEREAPTIQISAEHNGNFTKNLITILCETRVGLYVANPGAIVEVTLS